MATMDDKSIFIDSNVLVYANVAEAPLHAESLPKINHYRGLGWRMWINHQVIREFLVIRSRPQAFGDPCPVQTLIERVTYFRNTFQMAMETSSTLDKLNTLLKDFQVGGKQVHDANIVACMMSYGVKSLLTHNVSDFNRYSSIITVIPLDS